MTWKRILGLEDEGRLARRQIVHENLNKAQVSVASARRTVKALDETLRIAMEAVQKLERDIKNTKAKNRE